MTNFPAKSKLETNAWLPIVLIAGYFFAGLIFISPAGNFPLNDDWVYGKGVQALLEHGTWFLPTTCSACFVTVGVGALACKVFGFSYTVLRCTTLLFALLGTLAFYFVLRELGVSRTLSTFTSLVYLSNPLVLNLSYSFMTDVPSFAFTNLYLLFLFRGMRRHSVIGVLISALMFALAIATRQGIVVFVGANAVLVLLYLLRRKQSNLSPSWSPGLFFSLLFGLVVLPLALAWGLEHWLAVADKFSDSYVWFKARHIAFIREGLHRPLQMLYSVLMTLGEVSCYMALFSLPLLASFFGLFASLWQKSPKIKGLWFFIGGALMAASLVHLVIVQGKLMPFNQNMVRLPTIGAANILGIGIAPLKSTYRTWLGYLCGISATLMLALLGQGSELTLGRVMEQAKTFFQGKTQAEGEDKSWIATMQIALCFMLAVIGLIMAAAESTVLDVDRHYMFAFVPVIICLTLLFDMLKVRFRALPSTILLIFFALYSLCATQDTLSWNRARWRAARELEAMHVNVNDIDGGAEYNFDHDPTLWVKTFKCKGGFDSPRNKWRWWRVNGDRYIISFSPIPGYEILKQEEYFSGLALAKRAVLVLKQAPEEGSLPAPQSAQAKEKSAGGARK